MEVLEVVAEILVQTPVELAIRRVHHHHKVTMVEIPTLLQMQWAEEVGQVPSVVLESAQLPVMAALVLRHQSRDHQ
ncbi:MAG: hypothetical protein EBR82_73770 [Caulobacteraceae bacterium]|nr:hypothetical protein [Caulobacteraceae bacterium]